MENCASRIKEVSKNDSEYKKYMKKLTFFFGSFIEITSNDNIEIRNRCMAYKNHDNKQKTKSTPKIIPISVCTSKCQLSLITQPFPLGV
jgi:hypothetical protein